MERRLPIGPRPFASGSSNCGTLFDYDGKRKQAEAIEEQMAAPDFWNNQEKAREVVAELKGLKAVLKPLEEAIKAADDLAALVEMAQEDDELGRRSAPRPWSGWSRRSRSWRPRPC